jgi:hypothetical protein
MGMSFELMVLAAASLWGFLQLVAAAQVATFARAKRWHPETRSLLTSKDRHRSKWGFPFVAQQVKLHAKCFDLTGLV